MLGMGWAGGGKHPKCRLVPTHRVTYAVKLLRADGLCDTAILAVFRSVV